MSFAAIFIPLSFLAIAGLSLYALWRDGLPFSLNKMFWLFCLFFMGITPLLQYASDSLPFAWTGNQNNLTAYVWTNLLILLAMITYLFVYRTVSREKTTAPPQRIIIPPSLSLKRYCVAGNLIFLTALLLQLYLSGNWWYRYAADAQSVIQNSSLQLFADKSLKGIVLYFCLLTVGLYREKRIGKLQCIMVLFLTVLANFPTAIPRYWMASLYLGIGLTLFGHHLRRFRHGFTALFIGLMLMVFPILGLTRWEKASLPGHFSSFRGLFLLFRESFCGQDFDAYASLRNTLLYVQEHGLSWGKQLWTTLLFFIPRSMWPGKSIGSGAIVNPPRPGSDFHNFSSPLFAEGHLDFGLIGVIAFTGVCSWLSCRYDHLYWRSGKSGFFILLYPAYLGLLFFTLRGDLLSSFAYTVGIISSGWLFHCLLSRRISTS